MDSFQHYVLRADDARYHGGARDFSALDAIVWHCTAGDSVRAAREWLNRPNSDAPASYTYLIDRDPGPDAIVRMCPPELVSYHAGKSAPPGIPPQPKNSVNRRSLGIAFANINAEDPAKSVPLTTFQLQAGLWLGVTLMKLYPKIVPARNWGHIEVAPGRKFDPRPWVLDLNDWRKRLAEALRG